MMILYMVSIISSITVNAAHGILPRNRLLFFSLREPISLLAIRIMGFVDLLIMMLSLLV